MTTRLETAVLAEPQVNSYLLVLVGGFERVEPEQLEAFLRMARTDPGASWIVDMSRLTIADSSLIKFLQRLDRQLERDASLKVVPTPTAAEMLDVFDLKDTVGRADLIDANSGRSATSRRRRHEPCRSHR